MPRLITNVKDNKVQMLTLNIFLQFCKIHLYVLGAGQRLTIGKKTSTSILTIYYLEFGRFLVPILGSTLFVQ